MAGNRLVFRAHANNRMSQRCISEEAIRYVLENGEVILEYPDDRPYPSRLVLGWFGSRPLHLVVADNETSRETIVITVYEPDPDLWEYGFRRRKSQ